MPNKDRCKCNGTGWENYTKDDKEFVRPCIPCSIARFKNKLEPKLRDYSWSAWKQRPELIESVRELRSWRGKPWVMTLHADVPLQSLRNHGSGKTHAAIATCFEWIGRGHEPRYCSWPEIAKRHKEMIADETGPKIALEFQRDLLVLDELIKPRTAFEIELIDRIIDLRYRRLWPTIICTNLTIPELDEVSPRMSDRLWEGRHLVWQASSWRRR